MSGATGSFMRLSKIAVLSCCTCLVCLAASQPDFKIFQIKPKLYEEYAGNYQLAPDRVISLGPFSEAGGRLVFFDSRTRRFGVLYPLSETQFVTGTLRENGMVTPADLDVTLARAPTGEVSGLVWREGSEGQLKGIRVNPHRNEEVVFHNGNVELHGTLTLPATADLHPAVVLLQEAGPRSRPFGIWPYLFARYGMLS